MLRTSIVQHMLSIPDMLIVYGTVVDRQPNYINLMCHPIARQFDSVEDYILQTKMDQIMNGVQMWKWLAWHILLVLQYTVMMLVNDTILLYGALWATYFPSDVERSIPRDIRQKSLYIYFTSDHFSVISSVRVRSNRIPLT